jgi:MFS family permease
VPAKTAPVVALTFFLGGSIIAEQVILYAVASARYNRASRGLATGAAVAAGRVGSLVGPLVAGALLAAGRSPTQVMIDLLPIVVACGTSVGLGSLDGGNGVSETHPRAKLVAAIIIAWHRPPQCADRRRANELEAS